MAEPLTFVADEPEATPIDIVAYSGLPRDRHKVLKVLCAINDCTIAAWRTEHMTAALVAAPGVDVIETAIQNAQAAITAAQAPKAVK